MKKRLLTAIMAAVMLVGSAYAANPKREMRSTWLTTVWGIDWPSTAGTSTAKQTTQKNQMISYLDNLEDLNMTSTCFQVRSMGDAMYPSEYAPWSSYVSGTRGVSPGWDPLAFFVEEAHKRGLEAYVWLNPYRWSSGTTWNTDMDKDWQNNDMLIAGTNKPEYITFNPALPETRQLIVNIIKEILNNYAIDGILFDDYFYPSGGTTESSSAPDYSHYKASGTTMSIGDWRRRNVNDMVADCYNTIKELRPDVRFGIGPAGVSAMSASKYGLNSPSSYGVTSSDWQYSQIYSDPLTWMAEGTVDFISPQCYWLTTHSSAPFGPLTRWWSYAAKELDVHYYASHSVSYIGDNDTQSNWEELAKQVSFNREYVENNACGSVYYSTKNLTTGTRKLLKSDLYSTPALTPEITWKSGAKYDKVANLTYSNGTLTWDATKNGKSIIRYTVYAIPMSVTYNEAMGADGDGFDVKYLQKVVYGTSYTLDADKQTNYWYAVCVFDGYGKEHTAALLNYSTSDPVTLQSPVNGDITSWTQTFTWSNIEEATYRIEIAEDIAFSSIKYSLVISTNSVSIDLSILEDSKNYYWRVVTIESGKAEAVSEVATFTSPARTAAPKATLSSPSDGVEVEEDFNMVWNTVSNVETYTLQVSPSNTFTTIKYSKDFAATSETQMSHTMSISNFSKGTYYWRVVTGGKYYNSTASDCRKFVVTKSSVGNYESGYTVKLDAASYANKGSVKLTNLWMRSVKDDYNNISFEESGKLNRSFCVTKDGVYVSGRDENTSTANIYLSKYDIYTGEHLCDIILGDNGKVGYYPCNDVVKDNNENVCISNLSLNVASTPLVLFKVNVNTGELTQVASVTTTKLSSGRVDHIALLGDVTSGTFSIYAPISNSTNILRWNYSNGTLENEELCTVTSFYPTSVSNFGMAPRVVPVKIPSSSTYSFFIDGGNTSFSRYVFGTGTLLDSFSENPTLVPTSNGGNGGTAFELNGKYYIAYNYSSDDYKFKVTSSSSYAMGFDSLQDMWTLPQNGLGTVNSDTGQASIDFVKLSDNSVGLFYYVPGNGLCAYELSVLLGDVNNDGTVDVSDVMSLANYILGKTVDNFDVSVADINNDGTIDVSDVMSLANTILGK